MQRDYTTDAWHISITVSSKTVEAHSCFVDGKQDIEALMERHVNALVQDIRQRYIAHRKTKVP